MKLKNIIGHFKTITKHRWEVFKLSVRAGIPLRGLMHDLSKYSYTEFWESARYYQGGKRSPVPVARENIGYSEAWLHHRGRNKHHFEYWYDTDTKYAPVLPFKYSLELICDMLAAGKTYERKNWKPSTELEYWEKYKENSDIINPKMKIFCREVFIEADKNGINKTIKKKKIKEIYNKYCI